jgi:hypothetical protein
MFNPPKADKRLLASGEFDVHLLKQQLACRVSPEFHCR